MSHNPLALLAVALAALDVSPAAPPPAPPPSILLVTFDTTRADRVGCYGATNGATPNLDRLAREGTRFENALSPAPLTLPAHATIMTGRLPREHGVRDNALFTLAPAEQTLAEQLKAKGYRTIAMIGAAVLDRSTGIAQGFDVFDDAVRNGPREWFDWEERGASQVVDALEPRLATLRAPFFLWVHFYDPHFPYVPPESLRPRFKDAPYDGEIAFADAQLGRLLELLGKRGLDRRLITAVAGDHGESLGEHGEAHHGVFVYQSTQRVPLVLHGAGVPAGRVVRDPAGLDDLAPTLLDLAGATALPRATGKSLVPLLQGKPLTARDRELESHYPRQAFGWAPPRALVRWPLKFVLLPKPELYDLAADPSESNNLAVTRAADAANLRRTLEARLGAELDVPPGGEAEPDAEQLERLRSLGYAAVAKPAGGAAGSYSSIDPKTVIGFIAELDRGRTLSQSGKHAEAIPVFEAVVKRNPDNLEAALSLVVAHLGAGDATRAVALARDAVAHWPALYLSHFNLANALRVAARRTPELLAEAEREFRAALALYPRHASSVRGLAGLLIEANRPQDARIVLDKALSDDVDDPELALLRGSVHAAVGDLDGADRAFARAIALDPGNGAAYEARGRLLYQRGDKAQAAALYRQALDRRPSARLARTLGAILLNDLGDKAGARAAFERSLQLQPSGPEADQVRAMLRDM